LIFFLSSGDKQLIFIDQNIIDAGDTVLGTLRSMKEKTGKEEKEKSRVRFKKPLKKYEGEKGKRGKRKITSSLKSKK
jgi:hypothetical protein